MSKSLEDCLKDVDYSKFAEGYVPSKFAFKFISFIKLVMGKQERKISLLCSIMTCWTL